VLAGVQPCFVPPPFESQRLSMAVNQTPWEGSKVHCQGGTKQYAKYLRSSGGHTEVCVFHDLARGNLTTCRNKQCAVEQHHDDDDDYEGVSKMVGLVLNGVLLSLVA
jgi:hypothetical protein